MVQGEEKYNWLNNELKTKVAKAYQRGLKTILACQIIINNEKTAWCQQHHFSTYEPAQGRAYEHPSVTARESCDVLEFLIKIKDPDPEVIESVRSAVRWLERVKLEGYAYKEIPIEPRPYHETEIDFDRIFIKDSLGSSVWARYYDLKTETPLLSLRDGTIVNSLEEISFDRRVGYEWYGFWPEKILLKYPEWIKIVESN